MPFNVGENVGPYRIIGQLGQGGMATVFKAYHASLDRYVAIKALHPAFNQDITFEARFQREARVVAKLEHPNIVPVYDYAEHEKRPYLVMKFIEGDTLKARLEKSPLSSEEISKIVEAVGSALSYAHRQGVLHRDIKPSNVLVAKDGQMYLADFGLARIAQSGESTLSSDMIMGTPQYISPEQAMGKKDLDERTDLYSFGVMLYEMVVGQVPFNADTPFSVIHDHIFSPLPLPHTVNKNVPESVERVLLKALAKEREDRYETILQMVSAFKDAWAEAGIPMQGTFIKISQSMDAPEKTTVKPMPLNTFVEPVTAKAASQA
ncbi:MAG: serine/threonine-protein kinase, partial [Anaerolineales bacterium]